jgi:glucan phosphoethanolaminetransferase (alkaline phosphatase superfamily)
MNMQSLLVFGGIVGLIFALVVKTLLNRTPFQRMAVAFTILWATFVACHFWAPAITMLQLVVRTDSDEIRALGGFWFAFVLGALPGVFMIQSWMRNWDPELPEWFTKIAGALAVAVIAFLLAAHTLTCCEIAVPQVRTALQTESLPARVARGISRFTLRAYSRIAFRVCGLEPVALVQERVPPFVMECLQQTPSRPRTGGQSDP